MAPQLAERADRDRAHVALETRRGRARPNTVRQRLRACGHDLVIDLVHDDPAPTR
jgi:hypothetical protein